MFTKIYSTSLILLGFVFYGPVRECLADAPTHSIDTIAEGLSAAEAQFTDLRIDYMTSRRNWREPNNQYYRTQCLYAHKIIQTQGKNNRLRYIHLKTSLVDPNAKSTELLEDTLTSFDGEKTVWVYKRKEDGQLMKGFEGVIFSGYVSKYFSSFNIDPHRKIWYFAEKPIGELLRKYKDTFQIVNENEMINDIPTVKLVGQISDGKVTMTLWVSPERNFLPMKTQLAKTGGEKLIMGTILLDLIKLPNGLWYPKKIQSPEVPLTDPAPEYFLIYEITKISTEPISEKFFIPEFPPNTHVFDDILKVSYTTH